MLALSMQPGGPFGRRDAHGEIRWTSEAVQMQLQFRTQFRTQFKTQFEPPSQIDPDAVGNAMQNVAP